ncbi:hypothetical protein cyc_06533 [Cyclospora cayetanensis]|uniref:Uncharacterized protein n=1 Tax=Cyclospora cayetanensis TaxID=88456 RepID=A0A1D3D4E0_9EIME|nr:hypothetical protein cyc_06533 [Cyclospora cayetanensis]
MLDKMYSRRWETDTGPNCFVLPPGIFPEDVTVGLFKSLLAPHGRSVEGPSLGGPYHLRFRAPCPGAPSGFVWIDEPPEQQPVPTFRSSGSGGSCIVCKALLLPPAVQPKQAAADQAYAPAAAAAVERESLASNPTSTAALRRQQQQQGGQDAARGRCSSSDTVDPRVSWAPPTAESLQAVRQESLSRLMEDNPLFDQKSGDSSGGLVIAAEPSHLHRAHSVPNTKPHPEALQRCRTAEERPSVAAPVLDRADLIANREAKKQQRMMEKLQEVERRRALEVKQQQDRLAIPEELKQELDRWAKTADGGFKDVRTLLSTVHSVLWEGASWEPVSLSSLMLQPNLKKHFRTERSAYSRLSTNLSSLSLPEHSPDGPEIRVLFMALPASVARSGTKEQRLIDGLS